ncbi:hypothetical protein B0T22DRAFT_198817 [Podospora appendiculata]|uniref:MARVEL domain-containing protein n=1 Tax=Podospora appendiculata TaxID=314037 RepID=A0AAE0X446_9PEZI|nr:hypothetical protein B0T22DRAFT_198817 [Podospora appendiculata]
MWEGLEFDAEKVPAFKLGFHLAQLVFAFVLWCLEIVVFRASDAPITGSIGWTFGVCFLSIPAWVYLCMAPRFPRTRRFAQPYVMATVDGVFTIIWLSAFATQASYNTANLCGSVCGVSKAIVGLGFFVFLFFAITTFISIYTVQYWKWNGCLPGYDTMKPNSHNIDPDKAAFSMAPHDDEAYTAVNSTDRDQDSDMHPVVGAAARSNYSSEPYGGGSSIASDPYGAPAADPFAVPSRVGSHTSYGGAGAAHENPFRQDNPFDSDSEYRVTPPPVAGYAPPTAHDEYEDARFPAAPYDRIVR